MKYLSEHLPPPSDLSPVEVMRIIDAALAEDLGSGDATTRAVVPVSAVAEGTFGAREPMVVSGVGVAAAVFARLDPRVAFTVDHRDGTQLAARTTIASIKGPAHSVLAGERVALNLLQRMSGVATRTRLFVEQLPLGSRTRIADTRKTTPGLRALERYAVRCGGGHNHRNDLGAGLLIKDNHIALCGGVRQAIDRARESAPHSMRIEIEVDTLEALQEAIAAHADVIMLDNFTDEQAAQAMKRVTGLKPRPLLEISGGLTLDRIQHMGGLGVDVLSVGSITHGARGMDIGLDLTLHGAF